MPWGGAQCALIAEITLKTQKNEKKKIKKSTNFGIGLTLFALGGGGTMCPHRRNCPENTEKQKKILKKSTKLEPCFLLTIRMTIFSYGQEALRICEV